MLRIDRSAEVTTGAPPDRCRAVLTDVAAYPAWASLIDRVDPEPDGTLAVTGRVFGLAIGMRCALEDPGAGVVVLRRLPFGPDDDECYVATWTVTDDPAGARVRLHVAAALDAPGPAAVLQGKVGRRLVDDLLADFARAL